MKNFLVSVAFLFASYFATTAQTLVQDLYPGAQSSFASVTNELNGDLFLSADNLNGGRDIYKYDGSSITLALESDPVTGDSPHNLTTFNGKIIFTYFDNDPINGEFNGLYEWDGQATSNPTLILELNPTGNDLINLFASVQLNGKLLFYGQSTTNGKTIWEYDGTNLPQKLADIYASAGLGGLSSPASMTIFQNKLYFNAISNGVYTFFEYDGSTAPIVISTNFRNSSASQGFPIYNGAIYGVGRTDPMVFESETLMSFDGTNPPITVASNLGVPNTHYLSLVNPTIVFDTLFMRATPVGGGSAELWKYDFINDPVPATHEPECLTGVFDNNQCYAVTSDPIVGKELALYTATSKTILTDINPNGDSFQGWGGIFISNNTVYFTATDGATGFELYKLDGLSNVSELSANNINIYPNPANNILNLHGLNEDVREVEIVDYTGRTVCVSQGFENAVTVDISHLSKGVYSVRIKDASQVHTKSFVKF